jgi:hypothetical protein
MPSAIEIDELKSVLEQKVLDKMAAVDSEKPQKGRHFLQRI